QRTASHAAGPPGTKPTFPGTTCRRTPPHERSETSPRSQPTNRFHGSSSRRQRRPSQNFLQKVRLPGTPGPPQPPLPPDENGRADVRRVKGAKLQPRRACPERSRRGRQIIAQSLP